MRVALILTAGLSLSAAAAPPELERFDRAIDATRFADAATVFDALVVERTPMDGKPRPDSLLNAMMGRVYLAADQPSAAATLLAHVQLEELPLAYRAKTALAYASALESRGDRIAALAAYRSSLAASGDASEQQRASLGIGRLLLITDPAAARVQITNIADGGPTSGRWEARLLLAQASALLGDASGAARHADAAWSDAGAAGPKVQALLQVASYRAALAASRGDQETERAMLAVANGFAAKASSTLAAHLPVCGDDGVAPSDFVTFGVARGLYGLIRLIPVAASRPQIIAPFYDRLAGTSPVQMEEDKPVTGTVLTVACRSAVSSDFVDRSVSEDEPLLAWFADRGLYPASASNDPSDEHLNAVHARIDALQARFGGDSALLIEPKWQLLSMLETRARAGDSVLPGQLGDLRAEIGACLKRAGAPLWMSDSYSMFSESERLAQSGSDLAEKLTLMENFALARLRNMPFAIARMHIRQLTASVRGELPPPAARMILDLDQRVPKTLLKRERQAWAQTVGWAQSSLGNSAGKRAALDAAGIERDLCIASDTDDPNLLEQHFSNDDYPSELENGQQEGSVMFEFGVAANGMIQAPRIVYALPSGLFDALSRTGIATVRYTPAKRNGKAFACRGQLQTVVWRLEGVTDFTAPTMSPEDAGDIS